MSEIASKTQSPNISTDLEMLKRLDALESSNTFIVETQSTIMDILLHISSSLNLFLDDVENGKKENELQLNFHNSKRGKEGEKGLA